MIEAIERVRAVMGDMPLDTFEADWQRQWLVERGVEIISEASRHLTAALKARHPDIPWQKVAGIGNVLRHDYGSIAAPVMWTLVRDSLPQLDRVCREELETEQTRERRTTMTGGRAELPELRMGDAAAERTDAQASPPLDKTPKPTREATAATPPGVPFMITHAQRAALHKLGYSEQDISGMTPAYAHDLLRRSGIDLASLTN
jgi:uncharacterized protein with HEPN domain